MPYVRHDSGHDVLISDLVLAEIGSLSSAEYVAGRASILQKYLTDRQKETIAFASNAFANTVTACNDEMHRYEMHRDKMLRDEDENPR